MRRAGWVLALLASASVPLVACGSVGPGRALAAAAGSPVLRIAIGVDPDTLDPKRQTTTTVMNVVRWSWSRWPASIRTVTCSPAWRQVGTRRRAA